MAAPFDVLQQGLVGLFKNSEFSDFNIICGKYDFQVHKAVVSAQSDYFKAACKADRFVEGERNSITLLADEEGREENEGADDPEAVMLMVHFFYYLDYDAADEHGREDESEQAGTSSSGGDMIMHAKVFACAIKYQVPGLKTVSTQKFAAAVSKHWDHHDFAEAIKIVYSTTPADVKELRDIVTKALHEHNSVLEKPEIEEVVGTITRLAFELLRLTRRIGERNGEAGDRNLANCHGYHGVAYRDICGDCEQAYCYHCSVRCPFCYLD